LNALKDQGKIRAIGVSNFSRPQLKEAARYGRIDSLQPPYSLFWRHFEEDALPYCLDHTISVLAYSPMAQGLLTGKFGADHTFQKGDHRARNRLFKPENYQRVQKALSQLRPLAEKKDLTLGQLALAWVISQPGVSAIAGARNTEQAIENAAAASVRLTENELSEINAIGHSVSDHLDDNPIQWGS
jgi:aryl-alcohol dehydrogenase-like predicted oxidoreductase